jgi:predicted dehydrogenase
MIDLGTHMLDLAWHLLEHPAPVSVFAAMHQKFTARAAKDAISDVEDAAVAVIRFETGATLELSASWALNQPPQQRGTICRVHGEKGAIDVLTPSGAVLYRNFDDKGAAKATALKPPRVENHAALMRHFRECVHGRATPSPGSDEGIALMQIVEAIYKSAASGKSVALGNKTKS